MKVEVIDLTPPDADLDSGVRPLLRRLIVRAATSEGLRARVFRGTAWSLLGTVVLQGCAMLASVGAARILGQAAFGGFGMIRSTVMTFGILAGTGLGIAATKLVAEHRTSDPVRGGGTIALLLSTALSLSVAVIVPCVLGARVIAGSVLQAPELESGLRIASVLVLLNAFSGVQVGVLSGLESFRSVATLTAIEGCLTLLFVVGGAWSFGLDGAIAGSVAAPALLFWFKHQAMRKASDRAGLVIRSRPGQRDWPIILSVVAPAILIGVSAQPFEWLGRVLLARTPGGYAELGIFTAAYAWGQIVSMATAQVTSPVVPILANVFAEKDGRAVSRLLRLTAAAVAMIGLGVVGPVMLLSSWIMRVYGHGFAGGAPVLIALAAAYGLASLSGLFRSTLVATGRLWTQNLHAAVWGAVLIGTFVLQSKRDALALALSYLAAYAVVVFTQGVSVWRALRSVKRGGAPTLA